MLFSASASAQYAFPIEGEFSGKGEGELSLRTIVLDNEKGIVAASAFTGITGGCSGTIAGIGKYTAGTLKFTNYTKEEGTDNCTVTIVFDKSSKNGRMSESNCSEFHGPGCAFDGKIKMKR